MRVDNSVCDAYFLRLEQMSHVRAELMSAHLLEGRPSDQNPNTLALEAFFEPGDLANGCTSIVHQLHTSRPID